MYRNIEVEAEHNELILENDFGDKVIIPANKRNFVQQKLQEGCYGCIDELVDTLPAAPDYAPDGGLYANMKPYEVYTTLTGKSWDTAKAEGLTDGSAEANLRLKEKLINDYNFRNTPTTEPTSAEPTAIKTTTPISSEPLGPTLPTEEASTFGTLDYILTGGYDESIQSLPEVSVTAPRKTPVSDPVRGLNFSSFEVPQSVENIKTYQQQNNLPVTGALDEKTVLHLRSQGGLDEEYQQRMNEARTSVEEGRSIRQDYQDKVRAAGKNYKPGSDFAMKESVNKRLEAGSEYGAVSQCIGGVCTFLDEQVEPGLFKGGYTDTGFSEGIYFSNYDFAKAAEKEGWQYHSDTSITTPDVGDIIRVNYMNEDGTSSRGSHALVVVDLEKDEDDPMQSKITILDNTGDKQGRIRTFNSIEDAMKRFSSNNGKVGFYRRTRFGDVDVAERARNLNAIEAEKPLNIPEELKGERYDHSGQTLNISPVPESEYADLALSEDDSYKSQAKKTPAMRSYLEGINSVDLTNYSDIPIEDLKKIGAITAAIPHAETNEGYSPTYRAESAAPGLAKSYRQITRGTSPSKTLSLGVSQLNVSSLSPKLRDQYFPELIKEAKELKKKNIFSDKEIERRLLLKMENALNKDKKLQGQLSFAFMAENYRTFARNPERYGNDPELFWYALTNSWQSPNKALLKDSKGNMTNLKNLKKFDWDYSNNVLANVVNYQID